MTKAVGIAGAILLVATGCSLGSSSSFSLSNAAVDSSFACPAGATDHSYYVNGTIDVSNATPKAVTIDHVSAVMTLAAIHGHWLQKVGYKYETGQVQFNPDTVSAGSITVLKVAIPSSCTNVTAHQGATEYGDYTVAFAIATSSGAFSLDSKNRHRILGA